MIILRQRLYSNFSSSLKEAGKGAIKGAYIGAAGGAVPGMIAAKHNGSLKLIGGLVGGSALVGAGIGAVKGWKSGEKEHKKWEILSDPMAIKKLELMLPKDYQKFIQLEKDIKTLNKFYLAKYKNSNIEPAWIEFNVYKKNNKEDYNLVDKWIEEDAEYTETLVPVFHYVGYYYDDIEHTDVYYNSTTKKYYKARFYKYSEQSPVELNPKRALLDLLEYLKTGIKGDWETGKEYEDLGPSSNLDPKDWEKDYYEPCKKLINRL